MKNTTKEYLQFMIIFGAMPFLFFHAFLFNLLNNMQSLEIPLFVVFPLMWVSMIRVSKYMPSDMHLLMRRNRTDALPKRPSHPAILEAVAWYLVIFLIYYQMPVNYFSEEDVIDLGTGVVSLVGGYGAFFVLSFLGALISVFIVENISSLKNDLVEKQWKTITHRLGSVLIAYVGVALLFAGLYRWLDKLAEAPFSKPLDSTIDSMYFSVVTITTLGYGDITPNSVISKCLVMAESILGVLFLAVMVGLVISTSIIDKEKTEDTKDPKLTRKFRRTHVVRR